MGEYDYGNARLRAMKSRLLARRNLESLTAVGSVQGLITALTDTPYREAVEAAMIRWTGMDCLAEALREDLLATVGKARRFFSGSARRLVGMALSRFDIHNLKAILRGVAAQVPADEILNNTLPVGDLRPAELSELARAAGVRAVIDLLASWLLPWARPLAQARRAAAAGADELAVLELALDRWHMRTALRAAREADKEGRPLLEALRLQADRINILTALRLVAEPVSAAVLRERYSVEEPSGLFVEAGHVPIPLLTQCAQARSVPEAVGLLGSTRYGAELGGALGAYQREPRLSHFERALMEGELRHSATLIVSDPLGIGVFLAYLALKTNEVANLRAIAHGLSLGDRPERIRADLLWAEAGS